MMIAFWICNHFPFVMMIAFSYTIICICHGLQGSLCDDRASYFIKCVPLGPLGQPFVIDAFFLVLLVIAHIYISDPPLVWGSSILGEARLFLGVVVRLCPQINPPVVVRNGLVNYGWQILLSFL